MLNTPPTVCVKCGGPIEAAYQYTFTNLCETCSVEGLETGAGSLSIHAAEKPKARQRGKVPSDNSTQAYLSQFYSK